MGKIPEFDHNDVLPPYTELGPTDSDGQSPYRADIMDFCQRFSFSKKRIKLLKGFVQFRLEMYRHGMCNTLQWVDGSFVEDKLKARGEEPKDIDVVTFIPYTQEQQEQLIQDFPALVKTSLSKMYFNVDHYILDTNTPLGTIRGVQFWIQLFGHNRNGVWKGMVEIPLYADDTKDKEAMDYLNSL